MTLEPYSRPSDSELRALIVAVRATLEEAGVSVLFVPDSLFPPLPALPRVRSDDRLGLLAGLWDPALLPWAVHVVVDGAITDAGLTVHEDALVEVMTPVAASFASLDPLAGFGLSGLDLLHGALVHEIGHVMGAFLEDVWRPSHVWA
jgi:hypothetical protein